MKNLIFILLAVAAYGFLNSKSERVSTEHQRESLKRSMFMGNPADVNQVEISGLEFIEKKKINVEWIQEKMSISDPNISKAIYRSIINTPGPCPCPYLKTYKEKTGKSIRCGGNSSYSRPGRSEPICYPTDILGNLNAKNSR